MAVYTMKNIPDNLWRRIKAAAALEGKSIKGYMLEAVEEKMQRKEQQDQQKRDAS